MKPELLRAIRLGLCCTTGEKDIQCKVRTVSGGCIHRAYVIDATPPFFVKVNSAAHEDMFDAETDALRAIASTSEIRVPCPLLRGAIGEESFLVLEYLKLGSGTRVSWQRMGEQLAAMHRYTSPDGRFGWQRDNYIGATPQNNRWRPDWVTFWRENRLEFQFKLAAAKGILYEGSDRLLVGLSGFFADSSPEPSLLHGDLWSGNASFTEEGTPVIYDPACYFGDRECDLAFTEMFGGFPREFYEAYDATWLRDEGWRSRRDLYNLYHVLNHAHLFGGGYVGQAREMIRSLNAEIRR